MVLLQQDGIMLRSWSRTITCMLTCGCKYVATSQTRMCHQFKQVSYMCNGCTELCRFVLKSTVANLSGFICNLQPSKATEWVTFQF